MLKWAVKWRYILFFLGIGAVSALQSEDADKYPWAHPVANVIGLVILVAWGAYVVTSVVQSRKSQRQGSESGTRGNGS